MFSCNINEDGSLGIIGGHGGTIIIDMETGANIWKNNDGCFYTTFVPNSTQVILAGVVVETAKLQVRIAVLHLVLQYLEMYLVLYYTFFPFNF